MTDTHTRKKGAARRPGYVEKKSAFLRGKVKNTPSKINSTS
jgi:hypothetical protein